MKKEANMLETMKQNKQRKRRESGIENKKKKEGKKK
jgi:hypothetical protein